MNSAKKPIFFDLFSDPNHGKGFLFSSQKACLPDEITKLQQNAIKRLNSELPDGYIDFLKRINGYCDERIIIFASNRTYSKKRNKIHYIEGVIEANQSYYGQFPQEILLGQCGENWLAYDNEKQLYLSFSKASLTKEEAAGFLYFHHCVKYALMELQTNINHSKSEDIS